MAVPTVVIPGEAIGSSSKYASGPGTHVHNGQLYASTLGSVIETPAITSSSKPNNKKNNENLRPILSVSRAGNGAASDAALINILPEVDSVVLARVTRINPRQANVAILVIGEMVCADEFPGIIR